MCAAHWNKRGRGVARNQLPLYPETVCNSLSAERRTLSFVFTQLSNVLLPSAYQSSFSCPLPEQDGVIPDFGAELSVMVPAQQTTPASRRTLLCPPPAPSQLGSLGSQPWRGRCSQSLPPFIPGAMGSPGEQGRAEGPIDPRRCLLCFRRRWGRRGGAEPGPGSGRSGGSCPRRAGLR